MAAIEIYEDAYSNYRDLDSEASKYEWLTSEVFGIATYDGALDEMFGKKIIEVCKVILLRANYEYIKNRDDYISYILVCNMLNKMGWIDWGTSIRGAWFQETHFEYHQSKPILTYYDDNGYAQLPFNKDNLVTLIEFVESERGMEVDE